MKPPFLTIAVAQKSLCDTGKKCYYKYHLLYVISTMLMKDPAKGQGFCWAVATLHCGHVSWSHV
jgi:hypothetical protein